MKEPGRSKAIQTNCRLSQTHFLHATDTGVQTRKKTNPQSSKQILVSQCAETALFKVYEHQSSTKGSHLKDSSQKQ